MSSLHGCILNDLSLNFLSKIFTCVFSNQLWILFSRGKNNILLAALVCKILFSHSKIKFISSRHRVISSMYIYIFLSPDRFLLLYSYFYFINWTLDESINWYICQRTAIRTSTFITLKKQLNWSLSVGVCMEQGTIWYFIQVLAVCQLSLLFKLLHGDTVLCNKKEKTKIMVQQKKALLWRSR